MKRFLMFLTVALLSLPMLYGYDAANTTSAAVDTQGPAIEQALHYTTLDVEVQLNLPNPIAETQFYSAVSEFDESRLIMVIPLEHAFNVVTETDPATNEFIDAVDEDKLVLAGIPLRHAFVMETSLAPEVQVITSAYGMLRKMGLQDNMEYIVAGFSSLLIGSNTIETTDSGIDYGLRSHSLANAQQPAKLEVGYNYPYC